jgi:hypothetical protein
MLDAPIPPRWDEFHRALLQMRLGFAGRKHFL